MKLAITYDYLNQRGGGERVLELVLKIFPQADLFTLFYDKKLAIIPEVKTVKTSFLNHPLVLNNHRLFIPLMPQAAQNLDLKNNYDVILSIGAGYSKGISYSSGYHLNYCFTPLRYAWETNHYLKQKYNKLNPFILPAISPIAAYLRHWDKMVSQKPDEIISISSFIANRVKKYYGRKSDIIYPPVNQNVFYPEPNTKPTYHLAVGRLLHYKRFDLIISAFNKLKTPLKIVGRGPELNYLQKINTSPYTEFITEFITDQKLRSLYNNAHALIFPHTEDFGLVAAESISCGTPVIAYQDGGALDIIQEKINGLFINNQSPQDIINAILELSKINLNKNKISKTASIFSQDKFISQIKNKVFNH